MSTEIQPFSELPATTLRIGIVASRFNNLLVESLLNRVLDSISTNGEPEFLCVERVPGAHEIPSALSLMLRSESFSCMIGLGVIIKGSTSHHLMVADTAGHAIQRLAINHYTPIINGIVVTDNVSDAKERITGTMDRGQEFGHAAIEMGASTKKMDEDLITNPNWSQRRQNRATAFRFIFQWEINPSDDLNRDLMDFIDRLGKNEGFYNYAIELVDGIVEKKDIIDSMIKEFVDNWEFSRIAKADLSLLRVAIYEIQYRLDIPPVVVIDETLEISKEFSTENSKKFLNGVLDKFISKIKRPSRKPAI